MTKMAVFLQGIFWAVLAFFGITELPIEMQAMVVWAIQGVAGFIGPSLIEWNVRYRNVLSAAVTFGAGALTYVIAHWGLNPKMGGLIAAILVAANHLLVPSVAHPSRLADPQ